MRIFGFYHVVEPADHNTRLARYLESCVDKSNCTLAAANARLTAPSCDQSENLLIGVRGDPRLRSEPEQRLSASSIGSLYKSKGERFLNDLCGSFALAIIEPDQRRVLLAIDPMGIERLVYASDEQCLVFGDRADLVANAPGIDASINPQGIYDLLFFHMVPAPQSIFTGLRKLEPGTALIHRDGTSRTITYWKPHFISHSNRSEADFGDELRAILEDSVRAARPDAQTGAFLSGGLDSSTVAGYLGKVLGQPASTFSIGFGVAGYDELEFARIANRKFGCEGHEYNVSAADVLSALPLIAAEYDEPFGNSSAVPVLHCARLAKQHGMNHLLAGDGGDELFAGNDRYVKQKVFELYGLVPNTLREHVVARLISFIHPESRLTPLRKLRSYVDQASIPLPVRLETWNYAYREGIGRMLDPAFSCTIDVEAPMRQMTDVFGRADADHVLDRQLAYDWHFTLADSDLRKVNTMCESAGIQVSYPMLDQRLVELSTSIPAAMKLRGFSLRSFFKRAMRGFLPNEILNKQKHGFGLPFGMWLKTDRMLADAIYSRLTELKVRKIFRDGFIDELIDQQRAGHHAYYGFFVWDLAILEQWLARHEQRTLHQ
jgi:asparagine synthase (glutamine-hydrolysing)